MYDKAAREFYGKALCDLDTKLEEYFGSFVEIMNKTEDEFVIERCQEKVDLIERIRQLINIDALNLMVNSLKEVIDDERA